VIRRDLNFAHHWRASSRTDRQDQHQMKINITANTVVITAAAAAAEV